MDKVSDGIGVEQLCAQIGIPQNSRELSSGVKTIWNISLVKSGHEILSFFNYFFKQRIERKK